MVEKSLKELKEELKWLEETPIYIGGDGAPSLLLILLILLTGILFGIVFLLIIRFIRKSKLEKKIDELEKK